MNQNVRRTDAKNCSVCNRVKIDNGKNWYRNNVCAACYQKRYKVENPNKVKDTKLKCYYGIGLSKYNEMLEQQNYKCSICKCPDNKLKNGKIQSFVVDHCHKTQKIRGLLCHTCNMRVGIYESWSSKLESYLNKHQN